MPYRKGKLLAMAAHLQQQRLKYLQTERATVTLQRSTIVEIIFARPLTMCAMFAYLRQQKLYWPYRPSCGGGEALDLRQQKLYWPYRPSSCFIVDRPSRQQKLYWPYRQIVTSNMRRIIYDSRNYIGIFTQDITEQLSPIYDSRN